MKNTKDLVMEALLKNSDKYISGESLSDEIGVSRASVWKGINSLKKEGYVIESKSGSGYKLIKSVEDSGFSTYEFIHSLNTKYLAQNILFFQTIDSTNTYANKIAEKSEEGTVVLANEQTNGKGRTGKKWISAENVGVYFSMILKPEIPLSKASFLTQIAGASLCLALNNNNIPAKIKWPNDIIVGGKKISGILTEMNAEIDRINFIVVGIGINLYKTSFDELSNVATSIENEGFEIEREKLLKDFFEIFERLYSEFKKNSIVETRKTLRDYSAVLGKEIYLINNGEKEKVFAENIDENGNLIVRDQMGIIRTVFSGEISIRGLNGYI